MKKYLLTFTTILLFTSFDIHHNRSADAFKQLYALQGKWIMKTTRGFIGEEWVKVNDSYLQNKGFYVKGTDTVVTERVALTETKEGIFYTSIVENQNNRQPVKFKLTSYEENVFIFENPSHDFPKRIVYQLVSADSLLAYIDGGSGTEGSREEFNYIKVK